jgi:DNA-binding protein H-NS
VPTYKELVRKRAELEAQIEVARQAEVAKVIEQLQATIAEYGLTASDIWAPRSKVEGRS